MKNKLAISGSLFMLLLANVYGESTSQNQTAMPSGVFLSSPNYCFDVYFEALYLQPHSTNLHYAAQANPLPLPTPNWKIHDIDTDLHFGFDIGWSAVFHHANSNIKLDWERFRSSDSESHTTPTNDMLGPFFSIGPDSAAYNKARGRVTFHFDKVQLDYGIFVNFGNRLQTNLFAGAAFARIKQMLSSKYSSPDQNSRSIKTPSKFTGGGPQIGLDFAYRIVDGFQFTGGSIASLFVGTMTNHTIYKSYSPSLAPLGISPPNQQSTKVNRRNEVVPAVEGNLGLAYCYKFCKHYMFKIEAGYEVEVYFNAIQSADIGSEVIDILPFASDVGVYARTFQRNVSNFTLAGPYAKIEFGF